jgi:hypothetical protein
MREILRFCYLKSRDDREPDSPDCACLGPDHADRADRYPLNNSRLSDIDRRLNARIDDLRSHMDARFDDMRATWQSELPRVEEVLNGRLKPLEAR